MHFHVGHIFHEVEHIAINAAEHYVEHEVESFVQHEATNVVATVVGSLL
jgi:hypothetical protein